VTAANFKQWRILNFDKGERIFMGVGGAAQTGCLGQNPQKLNSSAYMRANAE